MTGLLKRIGLLDNLKIELSIDRSEFVNTLRANIDEPQADFFDIFSSSKKAYKGTVNYGGFELKRKRRFFDMNINLAKSKGRFTQTGNKLIVDIEVNGFHYLVIPFLVFGVIIYSIFIVTILTGNMNGNEDGWALPFILFHAALMFGIPYFIMRRSLRATKYDIVRDIYYMMKDKLKHPAMTL